MNTWQLIQIITLLNISNPEGFGEILNAELIREHFRRSRNQVFIFLDIFFRWENLRMPSHEILF